MEFKSRIGRIGAFAGWATLVGILFFEVIGPQLVAGQRVTGTLDAAVISAYYNHSTLEYLNAGVFLAAGAFLVFAVALREILGGDSYSRFLATIGLAFAVTETSLIITKSALAATLVRIAASGGDILPLFRFWDVLYNSGVYLTEAGLTLSFALAMRNVSGFPRLAMWLGIVVGVLQIVNMTSIFVGIPDAATLIGNIAFALWLGTTSFILSRLASSATILQTSAAN